MKKSTLERLVRIENEAISITERNELMNVLHTSVEKFLRSKREFDKCSTMLEFFRWYNALDCQLLCFAIKNFAAGFLEDWQTNIHRFKSVSQISPLIFRIRFSIFVVKISLN